MNSPRRINYYRRVPAQGSKQPVYAPNSARVVYQPSPRSISNPPLSARVPASSNPRIVGNQKLPYAQYSPRPLVNSPQRQVVIKQPQASPQRPPTYPRYRYVPVRNKTPGRGQNGLTDYFKPFMASLPKGITLAGSSKYSIPSADKFRLFEIVEDNLLDKFNLYLTSYQKIEKKLLTIKDTLNRGLVHVAAYRGSIEILSRLLERNKTLEIPSNTKDVNGDSPLDLACVRGFDQNKNEYYTDPNTREDTSKRFVVVKLLLDYRNWYGRKEFKITIEGLVKGLNSPLHWSIYWADLHLANLVYNECPDQIFWKNRDNFIPFDMCQHAKSEFTEKKSNIIVFSLLDDIFQYVVEKADEYEQNLKKDYQETGETDRRTFFQSGTKRRNLSYFISDAEKKQLLRVDQLIKSEEELTIFLKSIKRLIEAHSQTQQYFKKKYSEAKLSIVDHKDIIDVDRHGYLTFYIQRILPWFAFFKKKEQYLYLMQRFHVSPFSRAKNGRNTIHIMCLEKGYEDMLALILLPTYSYHRSARNRKFDLKEALMVDSGYSSNTPLHHAAIRNNWKCFKLLIEAGVDDQEINFRGWLPAQLSSSRVSYFREFKYQKRKKEIYNCVTYDPLNSLLCSPKKLMTYNSRFLYCIISVADSTDPLDTTLYKQLDRIRQTYRDIGDFRVEAVPGFINSELNPEQLKKYQTNKGYDSQLLKNNYIYKIKMDSNLQAALAEALEISIYNQRGRFHTKYLKSERRNYEPLRDIQQQRLLVYILSREFDLFKFSREGLVLDHFPLHHFKYCNYINIYWKRYFWITLFQPLLPCYKNKLKPLRPIGLIAYYHGIQNGFYIGFLVLYTCSLFPIAVLGLIAYIYGLIIGTFDDMFIVVMALAVGLWVTLFMELWKRREKLLAYNFDVLGVAKRRKIRPGYNGNYVVNKVTGEVEKYNKFSVFMKRLLVDFPLLLLGLVLVAASFVLNDYIVDAVLSGVQGGTISTTTSVIYQSIVGALNGLAIFIFNYVYSLIVEVIVKWENHKYKETMVNSLVLKNVFFRFFSSYLSLFVYAFVQRDFTRVANQLTSLMITSNLLNIFFVNIYPMLEYWFKNRFFRQKWNLYRMRKKLNFINKEELGDIETVQQLNSKFPDKATQEAKFNRFQQTEKKLVSLEQIEMTKNMIDLGQEINNNYMVLFTQFGYIGMFSGVFPAAATFGFLTNLVMIYLTELSYSTIAKRSLSEEIEGIGVWNDIFKATGLISIVVNAMILAFTATTLNTFYSNNRASVFTAIFIGEHLLVGLLLLLAQLIPDVPRVVKYRIRNEKILERKEMDRRRRRERRKELRMGYDRFKGSLVVDGDRNAGGEGEVVQGTALKEDFNDYIKGEDLSDDLWLSRFKEDRVASPKPRVINQPRFVPSKSKLDLQEKIRAFIEK